MQYAKNTKFDMNEFITDPRVPDPENLPEPLGWTLLVRPYPITSNQKKTTLIIPDSEVDFLSQQTNIGRVVSIGPCAWTRPEHKNTNGEQFNWVEVGDFVTWPKHTGAKRKFKGVSYVLLCDDEIVEKLLDPQVFDDTFYTIDIPQEDLEKYNSIYKKGDK